MKNIPLLAAAVAAASLAFASAAYATAPFIPGDLLVYRDATSAFITPAGATGPVTTLSTAGNEVFLDEYTTAGIYQGSIDTGLVDPGNSSSHGLMTVSPNGQYLAVPGFASAAAGGVNATTANVDARVVNIYSTANGSLVGSVSFTDSSITSDYRSAVTDGTNVWIDGSSTTGIRTNTITSPAATTSNLLGTTSSNYRGLSIVGGQLYMSTNDSAGKFDIVGTSASSPISTATGQSLFSQTLSTASAISPYQFAMFSLGGTGTIDTLYMSDDTTATSGIRKFSLVGGSWVENGDFRANPGVAIRGLTGIENADGSVTLYGTLPPTTASSANATTVYSYTDTTGFSGSTTGLTGTLNTVVSLPTVASTTDSTVLSGGFRGIVILPGAAPEPASLAVLAVGALMLMRGRSARRQMA